jgi:hypothetical protein
MTRRRAKNRTTWTEDVDPDSAEHRALGPDVVGFLWYLRLFEQQVRPYAPAAGTAPDAYSIPWYARELLEDIALSRDVYAAQALEQVARTALRVGWLYGEMRLRRATEPAVRYLRRMKAKSIKNGRKRGRDVHAHAHTLDQRVVPLARALRQQHPYTREYSQRWLSREVARRLRAKPRTVLARLRALQLP